MSQFIYKAHVVSLIVDTMGPNREVRAIGLLRTRR